jgi:hypothetical protein
LGASEGPTILNNQMSVIQGEIVCHCLKKN